MAWIPLALAVLSIGVAFGLRQTRWANAALLASRVAYVALLLQAPLYFVVKGGIRLSSARCEWTFGPALAIYSLTNYPHIVLFTVFFLVTYAQFRGARRPIVWYQEIAESFPALLDAMEKHAAEKLKGVDLAEIEWYHRLRNQLYHQGNGLTVERQKVEIYAELANILFSNLFGRIPTVRAASLSLGVVAEFLAAWYVLEQGVMSVASEMPEPGRPLRQISDAVRRLRNEGRISVNDEQDLHELRALRNLVAHGEPGSEQRITNEVIQKVRSFAKRFPMQPPPSAV